MRSLADKNTITNTWPFTLARTSHVGRRAVFNTNSQTNITTFNDKNPYYYFVGRKENAKKTTTFVNTFDHDLIGKPWKEIENLITNKMITKRIFIKCKNIQRKNHASGLIFK